MATPSTSSRAGPDPVPNNLTRSNTDNFKRCCICYEDEGEHTTEPVIHPCTCSLPVHETCLIRWYEEIQKRNSRDDVTCPQCKAPFKVEEPFDFVVALRDTIHSQFSKVSPIILASMAVSGTFASSATYGVVAASWFAGYETALGWVGLQITPGQAVAVPVARSARVGRIMMRLWSLSSIAPAVVLSRALPFLANFFFVPFSAMYGLALITQDDHPTWPPSPTWAMVMMPYLHMSYIRFYNYWLSPIDDRLNRALRGLESSLQPIDSAAGESEAGNNNNNGNQDRGSRFSMSDLLDLGRTAWIALINPPDQNEANLDDPWELGAHAVNDNDGSDFEVGANAVNNNAVNNNAVNGNHGFDFDDFLFSDLHRPGPHNEEIPTAIDGASGGLWDVPPQYQGVPIGMVWEGGLQPQPRPAPPEPAPAQAAPAHAAPAHAAPAQAAPAQAAPAQAAPAQAAPAQVAPAQAAPAQAAEAEARIPAPAVPAPAPAPAPAAAAPPPQPAARERNDDDQDGVELPLVSFTDLTNNVVTSLLFPFISYGMGELLRLSLPRSWTSPPKAIVTSGFFRSGKIMQGGPGGLLQQRWGRSLAGGCLFVVIRDVFELYAKYRNVQAKKARRIVRKRGGEGGGGQRSNRRAAGAGAGTGNQ
ncbi:hypothetical protein GE21DRAFT_6290 [Neurospora crassa]|uniref:Uncharacterized protein n=1 Tax=Neurospora crassa (strain ATCC 24698 / 74-OR23-1A / CBS 708.71 / DSM 1257 / FGSC 987) TaxID=367110 RepID=Q7S870_NEUCR|nr:hypothetical protein NCU08686 [Neurospora crassa OR74A]EAA32529.2 hypothetical protein NCU08686 [Neurospora crassa OR74A]KHE82856.1 hypothetical protein GE21DRAFT_6290 [Neurospora crassa]|eukprot:XP_961765.2 hypothetical protein NCU08686 [Neurospora crassa OR74A]